MRSRRCRQLLFLAMVPALVLASYAGLGAWRVRYEVARAQEEMASGRLELARRRLADVSGRHPGALGGTIDYLLGLCEATLGRDEDALRAFARVPKALEFTTAGAYLEARANLARGHLRAAETRLEGTLTRGGPDRDRLFPLLVRVYETQARFDDVRRMLRRRLADSRDPLKVLKNLDNLDQGGHPYDGLKAALEEAGRRAPGDDRVWLGKARLALATGRWDEAFGWLRACRESCADAAVWRAWLEWARGTDRPEEAVRALEHLGEGDLDPDERLAAHAWLRSRSHDPPAERQALKRWLQFDPAAPEALERLAVLARQVGESEDAAALRRLKAEVDRARQRYRDILWREDPLGGATDRLELARAAEAAGYRPEARALYALVLRRDPGDATARQALTRLDRVTLDTSFAAAMRDDLRAASREWRRPGPTGGATEAVIVPTFTDDAEAVGLRFTYESGSSVLRQLPEQSGGGVGLLDYDGDGWLDVYCVQGGPFPPRSSRPPPGDQLFRNRGDGTFEDATRSAGLAGLPRGYGHGVAVGDYDNDGDPDLFVTRWGRYALLRNNGDGTFVDLTGPAGLGGPRVWPTSAAFADLDGDGDLDLYVCHYLRWDADSPRTCRNPSTGAYLICNPTDFEAEPDHLFRNDGGRFVDISAEAGIIDREGRGYGVVAADLDDDRRLDLYVANDLTANALYRNLGGMRFEEVGHESGVAGNVSGGYQAGMGVAAGDLDGDGRIDLAVTNFFGESTTFYRNLGGGHFGDHTALVGLVASSRGLLGFGIAFLDANCDGRLDLVTANGHVNDLRPNYPYRMPAQLLLGGPAGRLTDVSDRAGAPWLVPRMGRGLAAGDLDNDGRQDLLILSHDQPLAYLHNRTSGGRSLVLRLEGAGAGREAIGARVAVRAGGRRLVAWRTGGGSFQSASDPRLHFGLGDAEVVDDVDVAWPSGRVGRYHHLRTDAGYLLREGEEEPRPLPGFHGR